LYKFTAETRRAQREGGFSFLDEEIKLDCGYRQDIVVEDKIILSDGSYYFPSFLSAVVFSESTESNKKFILSVLCVSAVNYFVRIRF